MRVDYLLATDDALIRQCAVDRYRASGPGGQHRNKTESAVRLRHTATGVTAIGEDSRSQAENKQHAVRRLRAAIALEVRELVVLDGFAPSLRLAALVAGGTDPLGKRTRQTPEYWCGIAELLDLLAAGAAEIGTTAQRLGITTGALSKLLLHDDAVGKVVNEMRRQRGNAAAAVTRSVPLASGQLRTAHGQPRTMHGQPRTMHGQPRTMHGQPRTMHGQPRTMHGQPRTMHRSAAGTMHGEPRTMHGQPCNYAWISPAAARTSSRRPCGSSPCSGSRARSLPPGAPRRPR